MLLEFTIGNYLSFRDPVTLSLEAASISDFPENTFAAGKYTLLKSAVIYGANASGKSNLLRALADMRHIVRYAAHMSSADGFAVTPFLLDAETVHQPCFFEVLFLIDGLRYRYGFELSASRVHTEWLYQVKASAEKSLFIRSDDAIDVAAKFAEGKGLEAKTRPNGLFLAVCDQFNGEIAGKIMRWFTQCTIISGLHHADYRELTFELLDDPECKPAMLAFLQKLDLGFSDVQVQEEEYLEPVQQLVRGVKGRTRLQTYLKPTKTYSFKAIHDQYDASGAKGNPAVFDLDTQESSGTNKIFDLLGPIFDALTSGKLLVVDELDAKLHPLLTKALVALFNSVQNNPRNAQLIFATHDTNLLTYGTLRRDQIWFIEKNRAAASVLYSLVEYKEDGQTVRKDRSFEKDYVQGRYGGIPYLGDFQQLFAQWQENRKSPNM